VQPKYDSILADNTVVIFEVIVEVIDKIMVCFVWQVNVPTLQRNIRRATAHISFTLFTDEPRRKGCPWKSLLLLTWNSAFPMYCLS
jgi:hypothetical protein